MSKHTPEPWIIDDSAELSTSFYSDDATGSIIGGCQEYMFAHRDIEERRANARRIVTCVNACAGMADPAAEIAELKRQRDELLAALGAAVPLIKQARLDWCDQNTESYDEDVVTPYDAILYRPILSLLETKGSAS